MTLPIEILILFVVPALSDETTTTLVERLPVYSVVKPKSITTLLAVNHGFVAEINVQIGDSVKQRELVMTVMERETARSYRSGIDGGVAKLHVTNGAAVTPGMPLVTIMDPKGKLIEVALSPHEAKKIGLGAKVFQRHEEVPFGVLARISGLVDPDTGAVLAYVEPSHPVESLIGDVIPIDIMLREIPDCKIIPLRELSSHMELFRVEAVTREKACLKSK